MRTTESILPSVWARCSTRWCGVIVLLIVSCYCNPAYTFAQTSLIVRLDDTSSGKVAGRQLRQSLLLREPHDARLRPVFGGIETAERLTWGSGEEAFVIEMADSLSGAALVAVLATMEGVRYVQPNYTYRLDSSALYGSEGRQAGVLAAFDSLQHLVAIGIPEAWSISTGSPEVVVGVIDSGLWFEHPAFHGQVAINAAEDANGNGRFDPGDLDGIDADGNGFVDDVAGFDFVDRSVVLFGGDYRERDPDPSEDPASGAGRGHGTAVSGVLAARATGQGTAVGAAPGIRLLPLRAFGADGIGEDDDVVAAILYAVARGVDVINLSFGDVYYSPLMRDAIAYATQQGVIVVASAGNDGRVEPHYPSDYPGVLSVSWLSQDGKQRNGRASRGVGVDLGAPGTQILTTLFRPSGDEKGVVLYGRQSGSSVAAPQVSAAAALLRSVRRDLSPAAIRDILVATASDIEAPGWDETTGAGLLRVDRALGLALPARVELIAPAMDTGVSGGRVPLVATALDPSFSSLVVEVASGVEEPLAWRPLTQLRGRPALRDTVGYWETDGIAEGPYTLRLRVHRRDGRTVEDRVRVTVDRTPPRFKLARIEAALIGDARGVLADVETDDKTFAWMILDDGLPVATSDRLARRHGLTWRDVYGGGAKPRVRVRVVNQAGLEADTTIVLDVPAWRPDPSLYVTEPQAIPAGYQLPLLTDFDADGRPELVLNESPEGAVGDTLGFWEWGLGGPSRAHALIATVLPRSAGDTDGDGRGELLTHVQRATLLLEAASPAGFPSRLLYADTTGLGGVADSLTFSGALLADLDGDGRGELIGHNGRALVIRERRGARFVQVARIPLVDPNASYAEPDFRVADLNRNGRAELIAVDTQGGITGVEATGDDRYVVAWRYALGEPSPRNALDVGDLDGDGLSELVIVSTNEPGTRSDREQEPLFATLRILGFDTGTPRILASTRVTAPAGAYTAVAIATLEPKVSASVLLAAAPHLYVLRLDGDLLDVRYHMGDDGGVSPVVVRSSALTVGDTDGDGLDDVLASFTDGFVHRLRYAINTVPAPTWVEAYADARTAFLRWRALADSVEVIVESAGEAPRVFNVSAADSLRVPLQSSARVALRAYLRGSASPLSPVREITPHAPARIVAVERVEVDVLHVRASTPLAPPEAASARVGEFTAVSALLIAPDVVRYRFPTSLGQGSRLVIDGLRDSAGTPVQAHEQPLPSFEEASRGLFVSTVEVLDATRVRLTFSAPLAPETVIANNITLIPAGDVTDVKWTEATPDEVVVSVTGVNIGPTGLNVSLQLSGFRSRRGDALDADGSTVLLAQAAASLAKAFVYPNPLRVSQQEYITIGSVPEHAEAVVMAADGSLVRRLSSDQTRGGLRWDLLDEQGAAVPSGMYLIRVAAPGDTPVLLRAAIIR